MDLYLLIDSYINYNERLNQYLDLDVSIQNQNPDQSLRTRSILHYFDSRKISLVWHSIFHESAFELKHLTKN